MKVWARDDILEYGVLPPLPSAKLQFSTLQTLSRSLTQESRNVVLRLPLWLNVAGSVLNIDAPTASIYFEFFQNLVPSAAYAAEKGSDQPGVRTLDFLVYLAIQLYQRSSVPRSPTQQGDMYPEMPAHLSVHPSTSANPSSRNLALQAKSQEETLHLQWIKSKLPELLQLIVGAQVSVIKATQVDALGVVLAAGVELHTELGPLSAAMPFWRQDPTGTVNLFDVVEWLTKAMAVGEPVFMASLRSLDDGVHPTAPSFDPHFKPTAPTGRPTVLSGLYKTTAVKLVPDPTTFEAVDLKLTNCQDSVIYLLGCFRNVTVLACSNCTIVLGTVSRVASIEHCDHVKVVVAGRQVLLSNTNDSQCYMSVSSPPLFLRDNHNIQVAPHGSPFAHLEHFLRASGIDVSKNYWNAGKSVPLFSSDQESSHSVPGMVLMNPKDFLPITIPVLSAADEGSLGAQCALPAPFMQSLQSKYQVVTDMRQRILELGLDEGKQKDLKAAIQVRFKDWLVASGNIRQVNDLIRIEQEVKS